MQQSLKYLRDNGWTFAVVEKWMRFPGMKHGVRKDVWGFGDILACRLLADREIALVQTTSASNLSAHRDKIETIPEFYAWKAAGGIVLLHGWAKRPKDGVRGARKVWTLKQEIL